MDKQQNELIKSYYRARGLAHEEGDYHRYENYEITPFALKNNLIDKKIISNLDDGTLGENIKQKPEIAEFIDYDRLIQINDTGIVGILYAQPQLINLFKHTIKVMNPYSVIRLLIKNPKFNEYANNDIFHADILRYLLIQQPQFYEKFKDRINDKDFNRNDFENIGKEQPELLKQMFVDNKLPPFAIIDALDWKWLKPEDFSKEQFNQFSEQLNYGLTLFTVLNDHPELLKYHKDWHFEVLGDDHINRLRKRYDRLINLDHNYKYLDDINTKLLMDY